MPAEIVKQRLVEIKARVECVKAHLVGPPANTLGGQLFSDLLWMIERLEAALAREAALEAALDEIGRHAVSVGFPGDKEDRETALKTIVA